MTRDVKQKRVSLFGRSFHQLFVDDRPTASRIAPFTENEIREVSRIGTPIDRLAVRAEFKPRSK